MKDPRVEVLILATGTEVQIRAECQRKMRTGPQDTFWRISRTCKELDAGGGTHSFLKSLLLHTRNCSPGQLGSPRPNSYSLPGGTEDSNRFFQPPKLFRSFPRTTRWFSGHIVGAGHF